MEFSKEDLEKLLELRKSLVLQFEKCRDYKNNKNALMKEIDHIQCIGQAIKDLDGFLSKYVQFS